MKDRRGVTLVELMVSMAIITIGVLGLFGAFSYITKALHVSRARTLATNLAQEKIESLKNLSYFELLITTASSVDNTLSPPVVYDRVNYPAESILIGGITFTRYTFVALAQVDSDVISTVTFTFPDTGMKQISVNVIWNDAGSSKKYTLTNLLENPAINPLDTGLAGTIQDSLGSALSSVLVRVEQNPDWNAVTDASGNYSFRVYHGSYTVRASSEGYYDNISAIQNVAAGSAVTVPTIQLTRIATGTVYGDVWLNPDILISGIAVSSQQANQNNFELQYIELYNPTTAPINIGGSPPELKIHYRTSTSCSYYTDCSDSTLGIKLVYTSTYVAPGHYFLVANTNTFTLAGVALTADAVFADDANIYCASQPAGTNYNLAVAPPRKKLVVNGHGGSVWLQRGSGSAVDTVGWQHNGNAPPYYEGTYLTITGNASGGFPVNEQIVRISSPLPNLSISDMNTYGHAYDSGNNSNDFIYDPVITTLEYSPRNTTNAAKIPVAGVPAVGAVVASSDPYSGSAAAAASYISSGSLSLLYAHYTLPGVTTGTWQITIASGAYFNQYDPVPITQGVRLGVPNAATSPAWPASNIYGAMLTSSSLSGFVKGIISDINNAPLSGIQISASGGVKTSGANGSYFVAVETGPIVMTINPNNLNPQYIQVIDNFTISAGEVQEHNYILSKGGALQGYLTSGTTPLPNFVVAASIGGAEYGAATSDSSGYFTIRNLSTNTYTVQPALEVGQDSSPNTITATVSSTSTLFIGTFTVSGAFGNLVGDVTYNGSLVTTGALLVAKTSAIGATPPEIVASSSAAGTPIYSVSSKADGTYILPVRGNATYYMSVFVPTISGTTVSVTTKTYSNLYVTPSVNKTQNVAVP